MSYNNDDDASEQRHLFKIEEKSRQILRKFNKRAETSGYQSLPELWQDFAGVIKATIHLSTPQAVQHLLQYTSEFHDYCEAYKEDTELNEYNEYFEAMDFAWCSVLSNHEIGQTDKVRIVNILRDGQDRAAQLGLTMLVYPHATDKADDEFDS
ncbi:hypothetical protein K501DRAFT_249269 [Backusella circina FSU 941]|nr:hypothetical protein K501DRAFT_251507 [Backusella circina FSU 941]KAI8883614.1 hypothetical protein K501DRAFT_249269 [Backusella circina FSU 941]